jgi:queuine/archaeosine tRNA-ribosyltransferase
MDFHIVKKSKKSLARAGVLTTPHGVIHTPAFVPVGTQATVKTLTPDELHDLGVEIILANTYHLYLRPGDKVVKKLGGLHEFMNFKGPMMTDSGGYQVFSLGLGGGEKVGKIVSDKRTDRYDTCHDSCSRHKAATMTGIIPVSYMIGGTERLRNMEKGQGAASNSLVKIDDDGVTFRSHLDGSLHRFTPEKSMEIQQNLGADIIFAFDECTSPLDSYEYTKKAVERTHRWALRCLRATETYERKNVRTSLQDRYNTCYGGSRLCGRGGGMTGIIPVLQALFGIVQGGNFRDLREQSAKFIASLPFQGFGIGGALGSSKKEMFKILSWVTPFLPENKPRHLLGIGQPDDFEGAIKQGVDLFDCVFPMRLARHGVLLTSRGRLNILQRQYKLQSAPPEKGCSCYTCAHFTRAYLYHLFRAQEMLGPRLATIHNVFYTVQLVKNIRKDIIEGRI